ncbi:glycosyltransferase family 4 protein [Clostridium perfringens]
MKILIVTELLAPYRVAWFDELGKNSEVTILYTKEKEISRDDKWLSLKPRNCKIKKLKEFNFLRLNLCFGVINELKRDYDIILLDGYGFSTQILAILYLKLIRKDFFMNIDGGLIKENENFIKKYIKKFFIKSPSYYLSSSKTTDMYLEYYGANTNNIYHHNFTSIYSDEILKKVLSNDEKKQLKDKLGVKDDKVIISVGRFIKTKGFDVLIKAANLLDQKCTVYIIGGIPTKDYLKLINDEQIKNVKFLEFKEKDELKNYYKIADLFVLPTRGDVWGLVINEAMACGLPVITTNKCVAGLELIENYKNGFIVEVDNKEILAEKISEIITNDNLKNEIAKNNLKKIRNYTIENLAKSHIDLFKKYLNKNI